MPNKNYFGFEFAKIAVAAISDVKTDVKYCGELLRDWDVVLDFATPGFENASQSTYLIFVNDILKYAGEYSGTF